MVLCWSLKIQYSNNSRNLILISTCSYSTYLPGSVCIHYYILIVFMHKYTNTKIYSMEEELGN